MADGNPIHQGIDHWKLWSAIQLQDPAARFWESFCRLSPNACLTAWWYWTTSISGSSPEALCADTVAEAASWQHIVVAWYRSTPLKPEWQHGQACEGRATALYFFASNHLSQNVKPSSADNFPWTWPVFWLLVWMVGLLSGRRENHFRHGEKKYWPGKSL